MDEIINSLKRFNFVHSIILFGSRAKYTNKKESDIDLCIITKRELSLKERLSLENAVPENVDLSLFYELPINVRERVFREGRILYTKDMYHVLTLAKETYSDCVGYKKLRKDYHMSVMKRIEVRLGV